MSTSNFTRRDILIIITDDYYFSLLCAVKKFLNELVEIMFVFCYKRPKVVNNDEVFLLINDSNNVLNLIFSFRHEESLMKTIANALN